MAKAAKKQKKPEKAGKKKGRGLSTRVLILLALIVMVPFSLPTVLVLVVGMLPTFAAAWVERGYNRYGWVCVAGLNFAGLSPWLFSLWFGHHTLMFAIEKVTSVSMLLVAYGGAGLGTLLYLSIPPIVANFMGATAQHRAHGLAADQRKLEEEWGEEVATGGVDDL